VSGSVNVHQQLALVLINLLLWMSGSVFCVFIKNLNLF
jgi:hypothetical protein